MSGGGGEAAQPRSHAKKGKRKKSKRLGVRIDMTPLVDVAFLLLTFFMLTTSMARPQTMEINLPPDDVKVEIAESNLMTLRVNEKGEVFWNLGLETPQKIEFTKLRGFIRERGQANSKLVTLVKIDPKAKYELMVNIMDELNQADMQRFSVAKMTDQDKTILANIKA
jgi:biopolymer transport protein ExbD